MNFDDLSRQPPDVADILKVGREDHDRERASHAVFAEVHEMHTLGPDFHMHDFSRDALGFSDVLAGLGDGKAVGGWGWGYGCGEQKRQYCEIIYFGRKSGVPST